jgi:hypothetical protein
MVAYEQHLSGVLDLGREQDHALAALRQYESACIATR